MDFRREANTGSNDHCVKVEVARIKTIDTLAQSSLRWRCVFELHRRKGKARFAFSKSRGAWILST